MSGGHPAVAGWTEPSATERLAMLGTTGPVYETWPLLDDAVEDLGAAILRKGGEPPRRRLETGRKR